MEGIINKCKVEWCDKKAHSRGLCFSHYHIWDKCGYDGGVYKIQIKDKIYIGKSDISLHHRTREELSALKHNHKSVPKELSEYFNEICLEELGEEYLDSELRKMIIDKFVKVEHLKETFPFIEKEEEKGNKEIRREMAFKWHTKYKGNQMDELTAHWYEKLQKVIDSAETREINKYHKLDIENGTNNLLNKNKVIK